ncbi:CLUMA_CG019219, isoform A [Clunio marinus]|uniref:CLUMA_CG019219, isoform A n=1 Tax=Clunio marinus TaxID=568069 RepID=A0A1J1J116_9DIPT|nr:CLUMA_CG019219, isoform A [Clunio marinus]
MNNLTGSTNVFTTLRTEGKFIASTIIVKMSPSSQVMGEARNFSYICKSSGTETTKFSNFHHSELIEKQKQQKKCGQHHYNGGRRSTNLMQLYDS